MQGRTHLYILQIKVKLFHGHIHQKQEVQYLTLIAPSPPLDCMKTAKVYTFWNSCWVGKNPCGSLAWTLEITIHSVSPTTYLCPPPSIQCPPPSTSVPHHPSSVPHHLSCAPYHPLHASLSSAATISCRKVLQAKMGLEREVMTFSAQSFFTYLPIPNSSRGAMPELVQASTHYEICNHLPTNPPGLRLLTSSTPLNYGDIPRFSPSDVFILFVFFNIYLAA